MKSTFNLPAGINFLFLCGCLLLLLFPGFIQPSFGQSQDAQLWENIYFEQKLNSLLDVHLNHEGRITNNMSQFYYAYADVGLTFKVVKNVKISADYVFVWKKIQNPDHQSIRHQWYYDVTYKYKIKPFAVYWRCMYQQQVQDIYSSDFGYVPDNYLRNKFTLKYWPEYYPWYKFTPYTCIETYYRLSNNDKYGSGFNRNRYYLGCFYNFNRTTSFELYYMIEKNFNQNDAPTNYVVGVGFSRQIQW